MTKGVAVYLARHGETDWNKEQRFQGQTDIGLNACGLDQATRLGRRMAGVPIDAVYSSDLMRALITAQPSADAHGEQVRADVRLRERHFGMFEGHTYSDIQQRFPHAARRRESHASGRTGA
jgi:probable phosphoglycerate mutase